MPSPLNEKLFSEGIEVVTEEIASLTPPGRGSLAMTFHFLHMKSWRISSRFVAPRAMFFSGLLISIYNFPILDNIF